MNAAHRPPGLLLTGATGFSAGIIAAALYLMLGGDYLWNIPPAAGIAFQPGLLAGYQAHEWGLSIRSATVVGAVAVGLAYGFLAVLVRCVAGLAGAAIRMVIGHAARTLGAASAKAKV